MGGAAVSGYGNVGMLELLRMLSPAATEAPPIQLARMGLLVKLAKAFTCSAVCVGSVMACGVRMTRSPSLPGSCATISTAFAYRSGPASPRMSMGYAKAVEIVAQDPGSDGLLVI